MAADVTGHGVAPGLPEASTHRCMEIRSSSLSRRHGAAVSPRQQRALIHFTACSNAAARTSGWRQLTVPKNTSWWIKLPEERLVPVLQLIRDDEAAGRRKQALVTLAQVQERMRGVTGAAEELLRLRDGDRG